MVIFPEKNGTCFMVHTWWQDSPFLAIFGSYESCNMCLIGKSEKNGIWCGTGCLPNNHRLKSTKIKHSFIFKALELVFLTGMRVLFVKQNHFSIFKLTFLLYGIYPHSRQEREKSSVKKKLRAILCIFSISILHSLREPGTKSRLFGPIWAEPRHLQTW